MADKTVVLGVTGSIAAYRACDIASGLRKKGVCVRVILTEAGARFITPNALEAISAGPVVTDLFSRETPWEVEHIALAKAADVFLVAPATADIIAKAACGVADDMLSTTLLATKAPVVFAPAMNVNMYEHAATQENMAKLKSRGVAFVEPSVGLLACGDVGRGHIAETNDIIACVMKLLYPKRDLSGVKLLVSAGGTREAIDPVRYITNHSSGKMGYAIARAAYERGAEVTLVSGVTDLEPPHGVRMVNVVSSNDMCEAVSREFIKNDALIMAAAPADFTMERVSDQKIKKTGNDGLTLTLVPTRDILKTVCADKGKRVVIGFAAETQNLQTNALSKLERKNIDMIAANDVTAPGAGFGVDTNSVTLYKRDGTSEKSGCITKDALADWLLDRLYSALEGAK